MTLKTRRDRGALFGELMECCVMSGGREAELDVRLRRGELDWNQGSVGGRPSSDGHRRLIGLWH